MKSHIAHMVHPEGVFKPRGENHGVLLSLSPHISPAAQDSNDTSYYTSFSSSSHPHPILILILRAIVRWGVTGTLVVRFATSIVKPVEAALFHQEVGNVVIVVTVVVTTVLASIFQPRALTLCEWVNQEGGHVRVWAVKICE